MQDQGLRKLEAVTDIGTPVNMNMNTRVAGVHKALVSAGDVTDKRPRSYFEQARHGAYPKVQIHQTAYRAASSAT